MFDGKRLAELRIERQMSQKELSKELDITVQALSNYENGHNAPKDDIKIRIARFFGVSLDYLMGLVSDAISYDRRDIIDLPKGFPPGDVPKVKEVIRTLYDNYRYKNALSLPKGFPPSQIYRVNQLIQEIMSEKK